MINDIKELRGRQPNSFVDPFFLEGQTEEEWAEMMDEIVTCEYGEESMAYRNQLAKRRTESPSTTSKDNTTAISKLKTFLRSLRK